MINKFFKSINNIGLQKTILLTIKYPFVLFKRNINEKKIFKFRKSIDIFTSIYNLNYWGSNESVSGFGSTLVSTSNLRSNLPLLLNKFSIYSIFDAPCGDFNWMHVFLTDSKINYIGGDIVKELIHSNNLKYSQLGYKFINIDLTHDVYPVVDLFLCRDCLFHLSFTDIFLLLNKYIESSIPYFLTTTHINNDSFNNSDILTGGFRRIDLFRPPFTFAIDPLFSIDDGSPPDPLRKMCLWTREQVIAAVSK